MKKFKPPLKSSQLSIGSQPNRTTIALNSSSNVSQNLNSYSFGTQSSSQFNQILNNIKKENESNESLKLTNSQINGNFGSNLIANDGTKLRSVQELPQKYRSVFNSFPHFNVVQSKVFDDVFNSDKSIALCAPTGSGKTVVFELAIIRLLANYEANGQPMNSFKTIYMAPLKVLVSEKYREWDSKFTPLGLRCMPLTGDSDIEDYEQLRDVNIVLTTPEKWDSMIRNHENNSLIRTVQLMLIDEVHLIHDGSRGAIMEAVISRMKTLRSVMLRTEKGPQLRFIAVSATAPNVDDIAQWLDHNNSVHYNMSSDLRPVKLQKIVMGYKCQQNWNEFRFDIQLSYKLDSIIKNYCDSKPTLVFCSTRKSVELTAKTVANSSFNFFFSQNNKMQLLTNIGKIRNNDLKNYLQRGVGFHHSGLDMNDRNSIEQLFSSGVIPVLISTTTLSMGVNLPAHLVIIKNTTQYNRNSCAEYPETQILQMIGRAGRPQFDTTATAIIMTKEQNRTKYENLLNGLQMIESNLHKNLVEQLNAEIAMRTITSIEIAVDWIKSTFLFIRVLKNPRYYGSDSSISGEEKVIELVQKWCNKELDGLKNSDMIVTDPQLSNICPTTLGRIMAKHCVSLKTMKKFSEMTTKEVTLKEMIAEISKCDEICQEVQLRVNEKKILNELNQNSNKETIRFPISGKIKTADMKVNCLIQAIFGTLLIQESSLIQDSLKIMRSGQRISKCLSEVMYFEVKANLIKINYKSLLNSIILNKCFKARLWYDSSHVAKQLKGIGITLSKALVDKGITSFNDIKNANPRDLEFYMKRNPPFGTQLIEEVKHLPYYSMTIKQNFDEGLNKSEASIRITVKLENYEVLKQRRVLMGSHSCFLILGNDQNDLFLCQRISDSILMKNGVFDKNHILIERNEKSEYINAHLISDSFVGLDVECKLRLQYLAANPSDPNEANSSIAFSDTLRETNISNNTESCQHKCQNKMTCLHNCCKKGLNLESRTASNKRNELEFAKQVTKNKKQQKTKPEIKNITDWLIKNPNRANENSGVSNEISVKQESEYFQNKKFSQIVDNQPVNQPNDQPDQSFKDSISIEFDGDFEFDDDFELDDDFGDKVNQMITCNEDFQFDDKSKVEADAKTEQSKVNEFPLFSMDQWSLFIPFSDLNGKTPLILYRKNHN